MQARRFDSVILTSRIVNSRRFRSTSADDRNSRRACNGSVASSITAFFAFWNMYSIRSHQSHCVPSMGPRAQEDGRGTTVCREHRTRRHPLLPVAVVEGESNAAIDRLALFQPARELLEPEEVVFLVPKGRQNHGQIPQIIAVHTAVWHAESVRHEHGGSSGDEGAKEYAGRTRHQHSPQDALETECHIGRYSLSRPDARAGSTWSLPATSRMTPAIWPAKFRK